MGLSRKRSEDKTNDFNYKSFNSKTKGGTKSSFVYVFVSVKEGVRGNGKWWKEGERKKEFGT